MPQEPQAPFISSTEAAKRFSLTNDHIGLLCRRGRVQGTLVGRLWYVSEPSLAEYLKKTSEIREARKATLSKQWRTAWTVAFIGFSLFGLSAGHASADFVSLPPPVSHTSESLSISIKAIEEKMGKWAGAISMPLMPQPAAAVEAPAQIETDDYPVSSFVLVSNMALGVAEIKDKVSFGWAQAHAAPVTITYAKDYVPEKKQPAGAAQPELFSFLNTAVSDASAAVALMPAPHFEYSLPEAAPVLTSENLLAGTIIANQTLEPLNDAMFALYADSAGQLARLAAFDTQQAGYVWDKTFGAFGQRFVGDLSRLNERQVGFYFASAAELQKGYDVVAERTENVATLDDSISVAAVAYAPSLNMASVGDVVGNTWNGTIDFVSNIFVAIAAASIAIVPASEGPPAPISGLSYAIPNYSPTPTI